MVILPKIDKINLSYNRIPPLSPMQALSPNAVDEQRFINHSFTTRYPVNARGMFYRLMSIW